MAERPPFYLVVIRNQTARLLADPCVIQGGELERYGAEQAVLDSLSTPEPKRCVVDGAELIALDDPRVAEGTVPFDGKSARVLVVNPDGTTSRQSLGQVLPWLTSALLAEGVTLTARSRPATGATARATTGGTSAVDANVSRGTSSRTYDDVMAQEQPIWRHPGVVGVGAVLVGLMVGYGLWGDATSASTRNHAEPTVVSRGTSTTEGPPSAATAGKPTGATPVAMAAAAAADTADTADTAENGEAGVSPGDASSADASSGQGPDDAFPAPQGKAVGATDKNAMDNPTPPSEADPKGKDATPEARDTDEKAQEKRDAVKRDAAQVEEAKAKEARAKAKAKEAKVNRPLDALGGLPPVSRWRGAPPPHVTDAHCNPYGDLVLRGGSDGANLKRIIVCGMFISRRGAPSARDAVCVPGRAACAYVKNVKLKDLPAYICTPRSGRAYGLQHARGKVRRPPRRVYRNGPATAGYLTRGGKKVKAACGRQAPYVRAVEKLR